MTKLVLDDYVYDGKSLEFISAFSGEEAKKLIKKHPDAACVLLDVVMETKDAGLEVARYIREDQKNDKLRIILRTGQPGKAPEKDIILNYDINDYKEKTELTTQKLFTTVTTALRSYIHLLELDDKTQEIAAKNIRLNEEIARRIVAESNLTKYNRSLEKMIDSKSNRLKKAISELKRKEKELQEVSQLASVGDISAASLSQLDMSGGSLKENLDVIDKYRVDMTRLLEKYDTLQNIISSHSYTSSEISEKTHEALDDIDRYKKDIEFDEILQKYPDIIKDSTKGIEHISKAVNDIKLFVSINDEPKKKTDINHLLKKVSTKLASEFETDIELQTNYGKIPEILIAAEGVEKAFYEVIKNAFEAVKTKGIISIKTSYEDPDISVSVSDIGHGIAPENMKNIFKPYFSKNKEGAKGLGLTFTKSVLLDNDGKIQVSSTYNEGTTITVALAVQAK
jgi:signal transduction histidine kinase